MPVKDEEQSFSLEARLAYKEGTAQIDELVSESGFLCGLPIAFFLCPETVQFSIPFIKSLVIGLGGEIPKTFEPPEKKKEEGDWVLHTEWNTSQPWKGQYGTVVVWRNKNTGKFKKSFYPELLWQTRIEMQGRTMANLLGYGIEEAEIQARKKLESMLSPDQRRALLLCDSFCEQGKSGVVYWIRKNRPTIALRRDEKSKEDGKATPLCALCLHPLGWYKYSFAGIMTPSDDMIAHLLMIRGNEHFFWRKANQHQLDKPMAGV